MNSHAFTMAGLMSLFGLGPAAGHVDSFRGGTRQPSRTNFVHVPAERPYPRNRPCPCGSDRKFKKCCWEHAK